MSPPHHQVYACFRPSTADHRHAPPPSPPEPTVSGDPNSTTCLYHTHLGIFSLTWSRTFFAHSLLLHLLPSSDHHHAPLSLRLHLKPFTLWRRHGSKKAPSPDHKVRIFWDLTHAKFGYGPEPRSGFYVAVLVDSEICLVAGDRHREAYGRIGAERPRVPQALVLRREHVYGHKSFVTKSRFGGRSREISIDCRTDEDARLNFSVDGISVLQIKRLKWKFRGNETVEIDGVGVQISWDVYNWLFENHNRNRNSDLSNGDRESKRRSREGHAVFMFRFEEDFEDEEQKLQEEVKEEKEDKNGVVAKRIEWRKMRRSFLRSGRSSSSSSISNLSSGSSGCSSSVMEWASSADESELSGRHSYGFSLVLYAWRK